uniref:Small ribosomal subunit protein uS9c n=1 Tax=Phacus inflexus TaxID=461210 RepID=A0A3G3LKS9_9EUGL|nr:ribosomal protein S9 [Phacus inflexus]AYQ93308.1 ribosomal protein S9 [Phacus inflexus]
MIEQKLKNLGRRKSAIALVKIVSGTGIISINGKDSTEFLQFNPKLIKCIKSPLNILNLDEKYDIFVKTKGGGVTGQSEAIKLSIARAIYNYVDDASRRKLKENGFLTRNSLCKERRKYGLKKARKAPQFSKR